MEGSAAMLETLRRRGVADERVLAAMAAVPREAFVQSRLRELAYADRALDAGHGQTISQPLMVASATAAVEPGPADLALEVGGGTGYQAAILAQLCARVVAIELVAELAEAARERLRRLHIENVDVRTGDGRAGAADAAPFDVIVVSAAADEVPPALVDQLADGGRLVIPVNVPGREHQDFTLLRRDGGELRRRVLFPASYVPLI